MSSSDESVPRGLSTHATDWTLISGGFFFLGCMDGVWGSIGVLAFRKKERKVFFLSKRDVVGRGGLRLKARDDDNTIPMVPPRRIFQTFDASRALYMRSWDAMLFYVLYNTCWGRVV
jgi:hypothetical protein